MELGLWLDRGLFYLMSLVEDVIPLIEIGIEG